MADEADRELERSAQGGDLEAEAELLRSQLRAGALSERALARAASLGFEPAQIALGLAEPAGEDWIGALHSLSLSGGARAALAAQWAHDPAACGLGWELAARWARDPRPSHHATARAELARGAARVEELVLLSGLVHSDRGRLRGIVEAAALHVPELREVIRDALVPWLLGRGDPLGRILDARAADGLFPREGPAE